MYLGLDLGTSGLKGLLIDEGQSVVGSSSAALDVQRPHPGWSEQNPANWIEAAETVLASLKADYPAAMDQLKGIGLSGHMHGATLVDANGAVLRPCILWNDTRAAKEAALLDADPRFREQTGNIVFPGFTAPKLAWVQKYEPEVFERTAKVLLPKDYLRLWLSGDYVSDLSDASGTSWLNVHARDWSADLLAATGLSRAHMPTLVEGSAISGVLRPVLAERYGLPSGIVIAGGAGDNAASAIGMGTVAEGHAFASLGTSGVLFAANDSYRPNADSAVHTFCHALPGRWHQMGVILAATDALNWYAGVAGQSAPALTEKLGDIRAPGRALFLPYLGGERTPHNDATVRGAFLGLSHGDDTAALACAVLEGVAFAFADTLSALHDAGTTLTRITAVGGGAQSDYWLRVLASTLNLPIDVPEGAELGAAFGAARLGMMAATGSGAELCTPPRIRTTIEPITALHPAFEAARARWQAAYPLIKDLPQ